MLKRILVVSALLMMLMTGFAMVPQGKAHAMARNASTPLYSSPCSTTPSWNTCFDTDPITSGCTSTPPTTLADTSQKLVSWGGHTWYVQQRYSYNCSTRWTRLEQADGSGACVTGLEIRIVVHYVAYWLQLGYQEGTQLCDGAWTNQLYDPQPEWPSKPTAEIFTSDNQIQYASSI